MKDTSIDDLADYLTSLILRGATEVSLELLGGLTVLRWRFPNEPGRILPLEEV